jgi:hypothetical protein
MKGHRSRPPPPPGAAGRGGTGLLFCSAATVHMTGRLVSDTLPFVVDSARLDCAHATARSPRRSDR